ncbi:MAG: molybdopterin cofactor-binding domain-containing protein [Gammaproteobacteria bacterium]
MTELELDLGNTSKLTLTRRDVLTGVGGLLFTLAVCRPRAAHGADQEAMELTAWVRLNGDNTMTIYNPSAEMGQGAMTAIPLIIAEELDADWSLVNVEFSPIVSEVYGRRRRGGRSMSTTGSQSVAGFFMPLRTLGAQARYVLMENAARHWAVPVTELTTEPSVVVHVPSGQRLTYGEIAAFAEMPEILPELSASDLKPVSQFRLIGHSQPRRDIPEKVNGSARYAMDVTLPGMLYGMIQRAPVNGARPESANVESVSEQPGITDVVFLDHGIGIVGVSINAVLKARKLLEVSWSRDAFAEGFDSDLAFEDFSRIANDAVEDAATSTPERGRGFVQTGDVPGALARSARTYEAEYLNDHVYHAQMEPLNAVAAVNSAGDGAEIWIGSQSPDAAGAAVANLLGIASDRVTVHPHYLGGGFGRRTINDDAVEAARLSQAAQQPVKLIWTREDDLQNGAFRPMSLQRMEAGVDEQGYPIAWRHYVVGDETGLQTSGVDIPFYGIANKDIKPVATPTGVRLKHWRAVGHGYNKFAIESFIDEIASDRGIDPYEFRRRLLANSPRELQVLDTVAEMASWGSRRPSGRAVGIAFAERSNTPSAGIAEVSVDYASGKIRVHHFWVAVDAGIVVQPDIATAQIEGAITQGVSSLLSERISIREGRVEQSNFHDYRVMSMADSFPVTVQLISNEHRPTGIGEAGLPTTGGAVANAFAALTGKRMRHMPLLPDRVLEALRN